MKSKTFYYARVSSKTQSLQRQIDRFIALGADERDIIAEKESGKDIESRPAYQVLKGQLLREGDTLVICSLDRLGRSKKQIKNELEYFRKNDIRLKILDIPTTAAEYPPGQEWIADLVNNILIEVLVSMAEQERENIRTRQKDGIASAMKAGVRFGRPAAEKPAEWDSVIARWNAKEITAVKAYTELGIPKSTFYKLLKR